MTTPIFLTMIALWALIMIRTNVAYRLLDQVIETVHSHNLAKIDADLWHECIDYSTLPSFGSVMFDLTLWFDSDKLLRKIGIEGVRK